MQNSERWPDLRRPLLTGLALGLFLLLLPLAALGSDLVLSAARLRRTGDRACLKWHAR